MWIHEVADAHLDRFAGDVGPLVGDALMILRARHQRPEGIAEGSGELVRPLTELPNWIAEATGERGNEIPEDVLYDLVGASVIGYFHVRAQDDFLDERLGSADDVMMLGDALLARAQALIGRHVGSNEGFWGLYEEVMLAYSEAMLLERSVSIGATLPSDAVFHRLMQRSAPLVIPAAAVLVCGDQLQLLPAVRQFVAHVAKAVQLANDLRDVDSDMRTGSANWVSHILLKNGEHEEVMKQLVIGGGFDRIVDLINTEFAQAQVLATRLGSRQAVDWCLAASTEVSRWPEKFFAQVFDAEPKA